MAPDGLVHARVAVVGHVEWVDFAVVPRLPRPGEILHAREHWEEAAGGGAVAAVQMAKLDRQRAVPHRAGARRPRRPDRRSSSRARA